MQVTVIHGSIEGVACGIKVHISMLGFVGNDAVWEMSHAAALYLLECIGKHICDCRVSRSVLSGERTPYQKYPRERLKPGQDQLLRDVGRPIYAYGIQLPPVSPVFSSAPSERGGWVIMIHEQVNGVYPTQVLTKLL